MDDLDRGHALLAQGEPAAAERLARAALTAQPQAAPWLTLLALSLAGQGRLPDAMEIFRRLVELQPRRASHHLNLGNACLELGLATPALAAFEQAQRLGAQGLALALGLGLALMACGRTADARPALQQAFRHDPSAPDLCLPYAQCLCELERFDEAEACLQGMAQTPLTPIQREALVGVLLHIGRDTDAEHALQEALALATHSERLRLQYALLLERLNRVDEAAAQLQHPCVAQAPSSTLKSLANARVSRRRNQPKQALDWLDRAPQDLVDPAAQATLAFERARNFDLIGAPDQAMDAWQAAHKAAAQAMAARFPEAAQAPRLTWLEERLQDPAPAGWRIAASDGLPADPVFLAGFPRSGTTLLECVLDSHPALTCLDERPALEQAIDSMRAAGFSDPRDFSAMDARQRQSFRHDYWRTVQRYLPPTGQARLVDKYPLHLTRAAHISRLFPRASLLLLLRHPCDCVLSCYMQEFGVGGGVLSFASLEATAETYARIMQYWEQQHPLAGVPVHTLRYEDLLQDFDGRITALLRFLDLPWHADINRYRAAAAARSSRIRTPSYSQVIEPLNAAASGRWRRYRRHFSARAITLLQPFIQRYGYTLD